MGEMPGLARTWPAILVIIVAGWVGGVATGAWLGDGPHGTTYLIAVSSVSALGALAGWAVVFAAWGPPYGLVPATHPPHGRGTADAAGRPGAVEIYQSTLMHIWSDGVVTLKEARTLANLRRKLDIGDEEAQRLEDDVKEVLFGSEAVAA